MSSLSSAYAKNAVNVFRLYILGSNWFKTIWSKFLICGCKTKIGVAMSATLNASP